MSRLFQFIGLLVILIICDKIFALPNDIERCRIDDDNCILKSSNKVLWKYYGGIKDINLKPLDPFHIDLINVVQDAGIVKVKAAANNTNIYGFSKAKFEKVTGFDKNLVEIQMRASKLSFDGIYSSNSLVLGIPINGNGPFKVSFNDFAGTYKLNLTRYEKDGKNFFKINKTKLKFTISGGEMDISDLGYITNAFLNASFDLIIKRSLVSSISEAWTKFFEAAVTAVFDKVAIEDIFLV